MTGIIACSPVFLIPEMLNEISAHLPLKWSNSLACVSRGVNHALTRSRTTIADIPMYFGKEYVFEEAISTPERYVSVVAPPAYGGTLLSILIAILYRECEGFRLGDRTDRCVPFAVPRANIPGLLHELEYRFPGCIDYKDPTRSSVLLYDKTRRAHYSHITANAYTDVNKLVVMSDKALLDLLRAPLPFSGDVLVVHSDKHIPRITALIAHDELFDKVFHFSNVECTLLNYTVGPVTFIHTPKWDTGFETNIPTHTLTPSERDPSAEVADLLRTNDKVVVFLAEGRLSPDVPEGVAKYSYASKYDPISAFHKHNGKAVLVAKLKDINAGLNLRVGAFVLDINESSTKYREIPRLIPHLLRFTNPHTHITLRLLLRDTLAWRIRNAVQTVQTVNAHYQSYSYTLTKRTGAMRRVLDHLGLDESTLSPIELLYYASPTAKKLHDAYEAAGCFARHAPQEVAKCYRDLKA